MRPLSMRRLSTRALRFTSRLTVATLLACGPDPADKDVDGPDYTDDTDVPPSPCAEAADVTLSLPTGPLSGTIPVQVTLAHEDSEAASLKLKVSHDGIRYVDMTVTEPLEGLTSDPVGVVHSFTWDSVTDLGRADYDDVTVQAVASSELCNPWPLAQQTDVAVHNVDVPLPVCAISFDSIDDPAEGDVHLGFTLSHPEASLASVDLTWSEDGVDWRAGRVKLVDCDGDGSTDGAVDLPLTPEDRARCLVWDSQADIDVDTTVSVRLDCRVDGIAEASATMSDVQVRNDPAPRPGDLLITELMTRPKATTGHYIEVRNVSRRIVNVHDVNVNFWYSDSPPSGPADRSFTISLPTLVFTVPPGGHLLLGPSDDPVTSGCRVPDFVWPETFGIDFDARLEIGYASQQITSLSFLDADGWSFSRGVALGVSPAAIGTALTGDASSWCAQTTAISGCAGVINPGENGTPGQDNDPCPMP